MLFGPSPNANASKKSSATGPRCRDCAVSLTYHRTSDRLECHYCGYGQRVPEVCPKCKTWYEPDRANLPRDFELDPGAQLDRGPRCPNCRNTGYRGRTGLYELLVTNDAISELIIARAPSHQIIAAGRPSGLRLLREDGWVKTRLGSTTPDEVVLCTAH